MLKNNKIIFFFCFCSLFMLGCGRSGLEDKTVLHLFSDAELTLANGTLNDGIEGEIQSILTYPHDDTLWWGPWQGKQALRFESSVQGTLRGSFHLFRDIGNKEFQMELSTWLGMEQPETWTGVLFWMGNRINQALGVRWQVKAALNQIEVQFFHYQRPELRILQRKTYSIQKSHWGEVLLSVQGQNLKVAIDQMEPLETSLQDSWHLGNFIGFYQNYGTGYLADLLVSTAEGQMVYEDVFARWNEEMVITTRKVVLESFITPDDLIGAILPIRRIALAQEWRVSVPVLSQSEIAFRIKVPQKARLDIGYGILPPFALSETEVEFQALIRDRGEEILLHTQSISPRNEPVSSFRYHDAWADLSAFGGREVEVVLRTQSTEGQPVVACWSEPTLSARTGNDQHKVALVMLDTLRADRLGAYGDERGLSPNIDRIAEQGAVFLNTIAQAPWTTPSHASLFTSLYPSETGCDNASTQGNLLQEGYVTLAEYFHRNGYRTAAFTTGIQVRGELGFYQGFDRYLDIDYDKAYSLETLFERLLEFLDRHGDEPWFLFIHTYAVHFPYEHEHYLNYRRVPRSWEDQKEMDNDAYDGGVRYADEWVGLIERELRLRGLLDSTLLMITSDHGEDLGERGMPVPARHGHTLHDEVLKVPLIARLPGTIPQGKRIDKQVRLLDLMPTIMEILGWKPPAWCHGISLMPLLQSGEEKERVALSEGLTYGVRQVSLRTQHYKLISVPDMQNTLDVTPERIPLPVPEPVRLFDLMNDPMETKNVAQEKPDKTEELQKVLNLIQRNQISPEFFTHGNIQEMPALSDALIEEMRSMGYLAK